MMYQVTYDPCSLLAQLHSARTWSHEVSLKRQLKIIESILDTNWRICFERKVIEALVCINSDKSNNLRDYTQQFF